MEEICGKQGRYGKQLLQCRHLTCRATCNKQSASQREATRLRASRTLRKPAKINGSNNCKTYQPQASTDIPTGDSSFTTSWRKPQLRDCSRDSCALSPCLGSPLCKQRRYELTGSRNKATVTIHSLQAAPNRVSFRCQNVSATNSSRNICDASEQYRLGL